MGGGWNRGGGLYAWPTHLDATAAGDWLQTVRTVTRRRDGDRFSPDHYPDAAEEGRRRKVCGISWAGCQFAECSGSRDHCEYGSRIRRYDWSFSSRLGHARYLRMSNRPPELIALVEAY